MGAFLLIEHTLRRGCFDIQQEDQLLRDGVPPVNAREDARAESAMNGVLVITAVAVHWLWPYFLLADAGRPLCPTRQAGLRNEAFNI